eukprot:403372970
MMALIDQNGLNTILSQESITLDSATDDTLIIAVSNESTGDFIFSRRFSGIIRPGLNLKRLQSIGVANGIWFAIHDSSSRAWLFWLQRDGISQQFYDTGLDFKFTGALVDNTLDRIIFSGFLQGMSNKIVLYAWSSALMLSQSEVYLTPNNDQIQIEHMVKNGQNLFGCVSSYYLSSSNLRQYGLFFNLTENQNISFYYSTENGNDKVYSCLGINYDSKSDTLIAYVKALSSGIPYINKIVIVNPSQMGQIGYNQEYNKIYSFKPDSGYHFNQIDIVQKNGFKIVGVGSVINSAQKSIGFVFSNQDNKFWRDILGKEKEYSFTNFSFNQSCSEQKIKPIVINEYPTGVTGQDNVLRIDGDLLEYQKANTTYSNVVSGKLKFEIIPVNQAFVCALNYQCTLNIARVTLKGCKDQGLTFTFSQSLQQFNNSTSKFEIPTIPIDYSLTTNQYDGVQMTVNESRTDFVFNTYTFRIIKILAFIHLSSLLLTKLTNLRSSQSSHFI